MRLVTAIAAGWLILGCTPAGASPTGTPPSPASTPATPARATAAAAPTAPAESAQPAPASDQPPEGVLSAAGDAVTGFLGTYCWLGTCADVFDTRPSDSLPLLEASAADLAFSLAGGAAFLSWNASYRADDDDDLITLGAGGSDYDPDTGAAPPPALTEATFAPPPTGDWVLVVQTFFEEGDAQYV